MTMIYNKILKTDLEVSAVCLGTWAFSGDCWGAAGEKECIGVVHAALDQGINFIDTAPIYGYGRAEAILGKALRNKRGQVILATKCGLKGRGKNITHDLGEDFIKREVDASLERLQTDYIDLYQCHWPDPNTTLSETMSTLLQLKQEGKIRHIGVSNFDAALLREANGLAEIVTLQNQYSLLERSVEQNILPMCREQDVGFLAYGSLAGGILSGKYQQPPQFAGSDVRRFFYKHYQGEAFEQADAALETLVSIKKPLNQVAINWVRQQPGVVSALVGARNNKQVEQNAQAVSWDLTPEEMARISADFRKENHDK